MARVLADKVCLVTGASRGVGKGIALQFGEAGATVYVTGRTLRKSQGGVVSGSLEETAQEIESRGGCCIPVQCDHTKDDEVASVFDKINRECNGQLDILVNNAYSGVDSIFRNTGKGFWEAEEGVWDSINGVGLRNHYLCAVQASRMMVPRKQGLIVNVSSPAGLNYLFNVAYGVGKAACDRMAVDCAIELRKHKVAMVSLWPGFVKTETLLDLCSTTEELPEDGVVSKKFIDLIVKGESTEFAGKCIVRLVQDPKLLKKSGRILLTSDLANEYNLRDIDGSSISDTRSLSWMLSLQGWRRTAAFIPSFIRVPHFLLTLSGSKF